MTDPDRFLTYAQRARAHALGSMTLNHTGVLLWLALATAASRIACDTIRGYRVYKIGERAR